MARGRGTDQSAWMVREEPTEVTRATFGGWRRRAIRVVLWTVIVTWPLVGLALVATVANRTSGGSTSASAAAMSASSPGRAVATQTVQSWLHTVGAPPRMTMLSWDGASTVPAARLVDSSGKLVVPAPGYISEIDTFTVVDSAGQAYKASVQVLVDPRGGAKSLGGPLLEPVPTPATDGWSDGGPWPGLSASSSVSDSVKTSVQGWATAYTSGDSSVLRLALGDTSADHTYLALVGATGVSTEVSSVAQLSQTDKSRVVVRVSMLVQWAARPVHADDPKVNKDRASMVVDLLVERADTAAPLVTAWGPPGSGPTLVRYGNAVSSVDREAVVTPTAASTTSVGP